MNFNILASQHINNILYVSLKFENILQPYIPLDMMQNYYKSLLFKF